jgi:PD-(D/E)XK nuclease superfamily protein
LPAHVECHVERRVDAKRMTGIEYRRLVARYITGAYGQRGAEVYEEVTVGTTIIGKQRRVDLLMMVNGKALGIECKYQDSFGTTDEKIPYALQDLAAQRFPGAIAYAGSGFSEGVLHLLQSSEFAAYCMPDELLLLPQPRKQNGGLNSGTWQLDHIFAVTFGWWDIVLGNRTPVKL